ncbi:uncharacterized protein TM35_000062390 [Trypanosoma theileri]|uniref:Phosphotyrosine protein phosphatase I domain-containing protein n=1 Tax=Trypanosoma theileri TaxID=67003 RepID=A0A1X0P2S0_9TRYP|nr:uncharacterized protein TM35_000062390 [Trypanosoma theileri]ORC91234.1 hypothetical protein TM35_000062390 [Trypanosoma theileri]
MYVLVRLFFLNTIVSVCLTFGGVDGVVAAATEGMASSSRGILIAGVTNRARTQMAEGILRHLTGNVVFIKSGGLHHEATVHPLAVKVLKDIGIDISSQSVSSLESARRQRDTYDVYISVDTSYERRTTDKTQRPTGIIRKHDSHTESNDAKNMMYGSDQKGDFNNNNYYNTNSNSNEYSSDGEWRKEEDDTVYYDPLLVPSTPSHWRVGADAADAQRQWQIWSPRDPKIFHETSTRKFQDHLYEGEPLFMRLHTNTMRTRMKISERWELDEIATRYTLERQSEHEARFVQAREILLRRCLALLSRLEEHYGERLLLNDELLKGEKGRDLSQHTL